MKNGWRVSDDLAVSSLDLHDMADVLSEAAARLDKAVDVIYSSWHVQLVKQVLVMATLSCGHCRFRCQLQRPVSFSVDIESRGPPGLVC